MIVKKLPYELDEEELAIFKIAVGTDDHSGTDAEVMDSVFVGDLDLWVWSDDELDHDCKAVIMCSVMQHRDGFKEFFISMLAGNNVMGLQSEVVEDFSKKLVEIGCSKLSAFLKPDLAKKFGAFTEGSYLSDKVEYVVIGKEV